MLKSEGRKEKIGRRKRWREVVEEERKSKGLVVFVCAMSGSVHF